MKRKKKLIKKIDMLAGIIAKLITPYYSNQNYTIPNKKIKYIYG